MVSTKGSFHSLLIIALLITGTVASATTPQEAVNLYNKACEASLAGQTTQALTLFQQAMQAGFDDLRYAENDPELSDLNASDAFQELLIAHQSRLTLLSSERGFNLNNGQWTSWTELQPAEQDQSPATVRLQWHPLGLNYEIRLDGDLAQSFTGITVPPSAGGPNVLISMAVLDGTSNFESGNTFHFLLGKNKTAGVGTLFLGSGAGWQPISELTPKLSSPDGSGSILISGTISWQIILPYHPLVDTTLGLNIVVQSDTSGGSAQVLFPDPHAFAPDARLHRFVPMIFNINTTTHEAVMGKVSQSVVSGDPIDCSLTVVSSLSGTGYLSMDFLDDTGNSVLPNKAQKIPHKLKAGVNSLILSADFKELKMGPYLVKMELEMPSGEYLTWSSLVLNMGSDWQLKLQERINQLPAKDIPTSDYYLRTITSAMEQLANRRHPGSLTTTLLELDAFLNAGVNRGSILPNSGVFLLVWQDSEGRERFCSLYLPVGHKKATSLEPVVLWADAPGFERRLASRVGKFIEYPARSPQPPASADKKSPIFLIPHSPKQPLADLGAEVADLEAFLKWTQHYFDADKITLAGMNKAAGAALALSLQKPEILSRMLIYSGAQLAPWPQLDTAGLTEKFANKPQAYPPLTWINFFTETNSSGQGKLLLSVMDKAGYIVKPVQEVKGGLSLTQVTDRLVLWAK